MAKAFDDSINERLRVLARKVLTEQCGGKQAELASRLGVSASFVSEFLNGGRGAGLETLSGLGRFAPLELLSILGIDPGVIVTLVEGHREEVGLAGLPEELRRAARAAVELTGCTPGEAGAAALAVYAEHGQRDDDPDWWLLKVRKAIERAQASGSGVRPSERPFPAAKRLR